MPRDCDRALSSLLLKLLSDSSWIILLILFRLQVGLAELVTQLRKRDINEAPLLFQAASERGSLSCFKLVKRTLKITLGLGGLIEQLRATDREGKNLLMQAARSRNFDLFKDVKREFKKNAMSVAPQLKDKLGCTVLHHAAEGGSHPTLTSVLDNLKSRPTVDISVRDILCQKDKRGRSPVMCALSSSYDDDQIRSRVKTLIHTVNSTPDCAGFVCDPLPADAVIHAARGGWNTFTLAIELRAVRLGKGDTFLERVEALQEWGEAGVQTLLDETLLDALQEVLENAEHVKCLLAQAALGGHREVLERVVQVSSSKMSRLTHICSSTCYVK